MQKLFIVVLLFSLFACKNSGCEKAPDVTNIDVDIKIKRLEHELFELGSKNSALDFIKRHNDVAETFLNSHEYPHDSILASQLYKLSQDPDIKKLYLETTETFNDAELEHEFKQAFAYLKYYYPEASIPEIKTLVTGFGNDLFVSDSLIALGLDYFIGGNATYRPIDLPQYILNRYRKEYIVPSSIMLFSSRFNANERTDKSVLADMIYYGKAYYFTKTMLPCVPDSVIIGYSAEQLSDANDNQGTIWAHFVDNQLIYETSPFVKSKYLDERPKTPEIGNKAPGRIGNFLGWKIVQQYMKENPEVTLQELMETKDVQMILMKSKYKPKNN